MPIFSDNYKLDFAKKYFKNSKYFEVCGVKDGKIIIRKKEEKTKKSDKIDNRFDILDL